jgi:hypothetical protein
VYAVVIRPSWWEPLRLLEDSGVVLEKLVEHGSLGVGGRDRRGRLRRAQARGRAPHDLALVALEDECPGVKILGDGTQRAQEVDAEDEVEAAQVDADACDGVGRACNRVLHASGDPDARQAVAVGHGNPELVASQSRETEALQGGPWMKLCFEPVSRRASKRSPLIVT